MYEMTSLVNVSFASLTVPSQTSQHSPRMNRPSYSKLLTVQLILLLCLNTVASVLIIENMWTTAECHGPPDVIYGFEMSDITSIVKPVNETWPPSFWSFYNIYNKVGACAVGYNPSIAAKSCCVTSLQPELLTYRSTSYAQLGGDLNSLIPASANENNYCKLLATDSSKVSGYAIIQIREGSCTLGYQCGFGGFLIVYSSRSCFNPIDPTNYSLSGQARTINTFNGSIVTASFFMNFGGELTYGWQAYAPIRLLVPTYSSTEPWDFVSAFFMALTLISVLSSTAFFVYRYYTSRRIVDFYHAIGQSLWILAIVYSITCAHHSSSTDTEYRIIQAFQTIVIYLASYYSAQHCLSLLLKFAEAKNFKKLICHSLLFVIHVCCSGSQYTQYWASTSENYYKIYLNWRRATVVWLLLAALIMVSPVFYFLYKVIKQKERSPDLGKRVRGIMRRFHQLFKDDVSFAIVSILILVSVLIWVVLSIMGTSLYGIYGSDKVARSFLFLNFFYLTLPFSLNCFLFGDLKVLNDKLKLRQPDEKIPLKKVTMWRKKKEKEGAALIHKKPLEVTQPKATLVSALACNELPATQEERATVKTMATKRYERAKEGTIMIQKESTVSLVPASEHDDVRLPAQE